MKIQFLVNIIQFLYLISFNVRNCTKLFVACWKFSNLKKGLAIEYSNNLNFFNTIFYFNLYIYNYTGIVKFTY
jgi:hypothetical protein